MIKYLEVKQNMFSNNFTRYFNKEMFYSENEWFINGILGLFVVKISNDKE